MYLILDGQSLIQLYQKLTNCAHPTHFYKQGCIGRVMPIDLYIVCGCCHVVMAELRNNDRDPLLTHQNIHFFPTSCYGFKVLDHLSELGPCIAETQAHFTEYCELLCLSPGHNSASRAASADSATALAGVIPRPLYVLC